MFFVLFLVEPESPQSERTATGVGECIKKVGFKRSINQNDKKEVKIMAAKDGTHLKTDEIFKETQREKNTIAF